MTIARNKPRVRFQGRVKHDRKNKKYFPEKPKSKQTNNDAHGPTKAPKVDMFSVKLDDRIYDDDSNSVDEDTTSFSKKRVLTTDDQESDGAFKSGFRTALILCRAPLVTDNLDAAGSGADDHDHELSGASNIGHPAEPKDSCVPSVPVSLDAPDSVADEDDEPPSSFLMQAPLWSWPAEWFPADSIPVAPEATTDPSPEVEYSTADQSPVTADATVDPSRATGEPIIDPSLVAEESTVVSSSATADNTATSSSAVAETISDLSSASADTISDLSSDLADAVADPSSVTTVTATGLHPAAPVAPVATVATVKSTPITATPTAKSVRVVAKTTAAPSLGPWHQWVVNLFAGRKSNKPNNAPQSAPEQPVSIISWTRERSNLKPEITLPLLPRLELPKALGETRWKKNRITNRPGYAIEIRQAPYHDFIGRAVLKRDADNGRVVQRGFKVASNSHLAPLAQRRNNSDSSLLDRDGDVWAAWNKLNITADAMPFAKSQSDTNLLHPQTGARMARNTSMYGAEQTKGQTGHCFLEDAGHRYPFGGLGL